MKAVIPPGSSVMLSARNPPARNSARPDDKILPSQCLAAFEMMLAACMSLLSAVSFWAKQLSLGSLGLFQSAADRRRKRRMELLDHVANRDDFFLFSWRDCFLLLKAISSNASVREASSVLLDWWECFRLLFFCLPALVLLFLLFFISSSLGGLNQKSEDVSDSLLELEHELMLLLNLELDDDDTKSFEPLELEQLCGDGEGLSLSLLLWCLVLVSLLLSCFL